MQQLIVQTANELEADAQRQVAGLYQDQQLMEKLREIQAQRQQEENWNGGYRLSVNHTKNKSRDQSDKALSQDHKIKDHFDDFDLS